MSPFPATVHPLGRAPQQKRRASIRADHKGRSSQSGEDRALAGPLLSTALFATVPDQAEHELVPGEVVAL
jgi:hypothetical protein